MSIAADAESAQDAGHGEHRGTSPFDAVLFDMDGVVTMTATVHAAAWKDLFDSVLRDPRAGVDGIPAPFDVELDYRRYVDGRNRADGVTAFLASRGVTVPPGSPDDSADAWTVHGLGTRKNDLFLARVAAGGIRAYPKTVALLNRLRAGGVPIGLVTASRNATELLEAAGVMSLFDVIVDGQVAADLSLAGKPDPAMFLEAASRLGVSPHRTAVIEDATAGVEAGRRGEFGLVVGIDRAAQRDELESAGADLVVGDVGELDLGVSREDPWRLVYRGFDAGHEGHREALTALGNGYVATRGVLPERGDDGVHYPGTYLAGVYNRLVSTIHGRDLEEEHLVNAPNWLPLDVRIGDGPWWSSGSIAASEEIRELHLRRGVLTRRVILTAPGGRRLDVVQRRLVSMHNPHLAALETTVTAVGWSGGISARSGIDARVSNTNVRAYAGSATVHLGSPTFITVDGETVVCEAQTLQSRIRIALAVRTTVTGATSTSIGDVIDGGRFQRGFELDLRDGEPATVTKTVAIVTSRDSAMASPASGALAELTRGEPGVIGLLPEHESAWRRLWDRFAVTIDADRHSQLILNLHVFHLLQSISPHTAAVDAGVGARGLHGEGYRGHVFWDELFVLPVIRMRLPEISRALLDYRWRRLDAARAAARGAGLAGALFPWQSGSDGREETPEVLYNGYSSRWMPDNSRRQRHVGLAIAYNAWQQFQTTGDRDWLAAKGAELIIEVTRMFASSATHDPAFDRYHIDSVMGPDEYHDGYPGTPGTGVRDNAYTNVLASWVCARAIDALNILTGHEGEDLVDRLRIGPAEPALWERLSRRLAVPFHADGVISQFDGYDDLAELDWPRYRETYGNIGRLDLILEAENDSTNRYKLAKQADVLMLVHLLGPDVLVSQLRELGYSMSDDDLVRTVEYYLSRTAHGSTLSRVVHASVLARIDARRAWTVFRAAMVADLDDTQGGTTSEGIHLGAMAGTVDLAVRAFAGLQTHDDELSFTPRLPASVRSIGFQIGYRGHRIDVSLDATCLRVRMHPCLAAPVRIVVEGTAVLLAGAETKDFPVTPRDSSADPPAPTNAGKTTNAGMEWTNP